MPVTDTLKTEQIKLAKLLDEVLRKNSKVYIKTEGCKNVPYIG